MGKKLLEGIAETDLVRSEPILRPGNTNCGGCGMSMALQMLARAAETRPVQIVIPACCGIVTAGPFPFSAYGAPVVSSTFASAAALASGLSHAARLNNEETRIICWAGDGGTYDIGMATVSAAAERNENILYFCYDNEIYGNTGGQRSSATPMAAVTTTSPFGKEEAKKDIVGIMAAHNIPYVATCSMAHPEDLFRKMRHGLDSEGFRFIHVFSPCPTGWKSEPAEGVHLLRLAVESGLYPVYEIIDNRKVVINVEPEMSRKALEEYFAAQGRFAKTKVDIELVERQIQDSWARLRARAAANL